MQMGIGAVYILWLAKFELFQKGKEHDSFNLH